MITVHWWQMVGGGKWVAKSLPCVSWPDAIFTAIMVRDIHNTDPVFMGG